MCKELLKLRVDLRRAAAVTLALCFSLAVGAPQAAAQDRMCDPGGEDCRQILIDHIRLEKVGLDVAFWFMEDSWMASEIIARHRAGVPVRVLVDSRANASNWRNIERLAELKAAGVPMRERFAPGILHWKMMLFAGQGLVEFSGANYSSDAWTPAGAPYTNYVDESIYFTRKLSLVQSFMTRFDDLWTDTISFRDYANINVPLGRTYQTFPIDPELNFPPGESYATRAVNAYYAETQKMDVIMFRITDRRHTDALIDLHRRGLPIRLITEPQQYRDANRLWHSWNVDRLYMAGIPIKVRKHAGLNHQKSVILYGQGVSIFGSSNWTSPSAHSQEEHNYFTKDRFVFDWLVQQFERKWNNSAGVEENTDFVPLPPRAPEMPSPAHQATEVPTSNLLLKWDGSPWAHLYDVYLGTTPNNLELIGQDLPLGPSQWAGDLRAFSVPMTLQPGTIYYWRVVGKTMAQRTASSTQWSFMTSGSAPAPTVPAPWTARDVGMVGVSGSSNVEGNVFTVRGAGADVWGTADALHWVSQPVTGDFDIVARAASVENVHVWTKAGVMIRESMSAGAAQALMLVSPGKGLAFQRRVTNGGETASTSGGAGTAPTWLKLERRGSIIRAYRSDDGSSWTLVGSDTFTLPDAVHVGLAMSSHDNTRLATATFDNVVVTGAGQQPANLPPSVALTSPAAGVTFSAPATVNLAATASDSDGTIARVDFYNGTTLVATSTTSPYAASWTNVAAGTYSLTAKATDNAGAVTTSSAVSVTVSAPSGGLESPWAWQDVGSVGLPGSATGGGESFSLHASGADVWGSADGLGYAYRQITGDVDIVARVASVEYVHAWTKAGVMIRESLGAGSPQAFMLVSPGKGLAFQRRLAAAGESTNTSGGAGTAPAWVKLERRGNVISAFRSADGTAWTLVGSDTFTMGNQVYVGLALSSHDNARLGTATFESVSVVVRNQPSTVNTPPAVSLTSPAAGASFTAPATVTLTASASDVEGTVTKVEFYAGDRLLGTSTSAPFQTSWTDVAPGSHTLTARATDNAGAVTTSDPVTITVLAASPLPEGWTSQDLGAVGVAGSAAGSAGAFTVRASGADVWGTADGLHFAWQELTGDFDVVARVAAVEHVHAWTKAGVMVRNALTADAAHGFMLVSPAKGLAFQRRTANGGLSTNTAGGAGAAPVWVKLERRGGTLTAYTSLDGQIWTLVGSDSVTLASTVYVGLALTSHENTRLATATFDNVSVVAR